MASLTLTPEEDAIQKRRGENYRRLITEACQDFSATSKNPVLFLSGGIDSGSILWSLLSIGVRPAIMSFKTRPGDFSSRDLERARHLAKVHDLPFHEYVPPQDPDVIAQGLEYIIREFPDASTRADIEIMFLFKGMIKESARLGYDSIYSGISDPNVHLGGREPEISGRGGHLTGKVADFRRIDLLSDGQAIISTYLALDNGVSIFLPVFLAAASLPYYGLDWKVMNTPTLKSITKIAYQKEIDADQAKVMAMAMQTGDSGLRDYFDEAISTSSYVRERCGRDVQSSTPFYNDMKKLYRPEDYEKAAAAPVLMKRLQRFAALEVNLGSRRIDDMPDGFTYPSTLDGQSTFLPPNIDEEDLFGLDETEEGEGSQVILDDEGKPLTGTDCFSMPLWNPDSFHMCERARSGKCGIPGEGGPESAASCSQFSYRVRDFMRDIDTLSEITRKPFPGLSAVYTKWAGRLKTTFDRLEAGEDPDVVLMEA